VLAESGEKFERHHEMKRVGYDLDKIEERVCEIFGIEKEVMSKGINERQAIGLFNREGQNLSWMRQAGFHMLVQEESR